jgi:hypothetical protein
MEGDGVERLLLQHDLLLGEPQRFGLMHNPDPVTTRKDCSKPFATTGPFARAFEVHAIALVEYQGDELYSEDLW